VGIEELEDLKSDIMQALSNVATAPISLEKLVESI
jgi:hypothetical protein